MLGKFLKILVGDNLGGDDRGADNGGDKPPPATAPDADKTPDAPSHFPKHSRMKWLQL